VLLVLRAPVPVLAGDALWVRVDAGVSGGEVAVGLDGVSDAALVGVDPVETCSGGQERDTLISTDNANNTIITTFTLFRCCLSFRFDMILYIL
jgi:hypothetical protein